MATPRSTSAPQRQKAFDVRTDPAHAHDVSSLLSGRLLNTAACYPATPPENVRLPRRSGASAAPVGGDDIGHGGDRPARSPPGVIAEKIGSDTTRANRAAACGQSLGR